MNKNLGQDNCSWALNSEQGIQTNGNVEYKLEQQVQEGDIIVSLQTWLRGILRLLFWIVLKMFSGPNLKKLLGAYLGP